MDNYAEACSSLATDYDINDTTFSQNLKRSDTCMSRAYELLRFIEEPDKYLQTAVGLAYDNILFKDIIFSLVQIVSGEEQAYMKSGDGCGYLTANGARGFIRGYRLTRMA